MKGEGGVEGGGMKRGKEAGAWRGGGRRRHEGGGGGGREGRRQGGGGGGRLGKELLGMSTLTYGMDPLVSTTIMNGRTRGRHGCKNC